MTKKITFLKWLALAIVLGMGANAWGQITETISTTGAGTWTCPAGVTSITVECWGGGGAGGAAKHTSASGTGNSGRGGGGAGGGYSRSINISVVPGTEYDYSVGAGGLGVVLTSDNEVAPSGGNTYFINVTTVNAPGGNGGKGRICTGAAQTYGAAVAYTPNTTAVGNDIYNGGGGGVANATTGTGNGGSSGGTGSVGTSGSSTARQQSIVTGGGFGAAGRGAYGTGNSGGVPGGGGAGAKADGTSTADPTRNYKGGNGGNGQIKITYNVTSMTIASGETLNVAAGKTLTIANGSTLDIAPGAQLTNNGTITNNGTLTVAGTLQLNDGAALAGSGTLSYSSGGTLAFNKTTGTTINGGETYWPVTNGPTNISVLQNTLTLNTDKTITGVSVSLGATLTTNANKQLTVGTLANAGTVTLKSDASGTATITPTTITGGGTFNVEQYLLSGRNWYLSSPVAAATAPATGIANYYEYIEAGNNTLFAGQASGSSLFWKGIANGDPLTVGKGYIAKATGLTTIQFSGALNNAASYPITLSKVGNGFNLVGNPYPAFLDWAAVYTTNSSTANMPTGTIWYRSTNYNGKSAWASGATYLANDVVYSGAGFYKTLSGGQAGSTAPTGTGSNISDGNVIWQNEGSVYVFATVNSLGTITTLNATNLIPPMQAFWVQTSTDNSTLTISKTQTSHNGTGSAIVIKAPKSEQSKTQLARLQLSNNVTVDEAIVYFNANASNNFDSYDSPKMFNNTATMPEIYTLVGTEKLVINGYNSLEDGKVVPLGFVSQKAGSFSIKATEVSNIDATTRIILKDNQQNTETDITEGDAYNFTSDAVNTASRFSLVFRAPSITTGFGAPQLYMNIVKNANNQLIVNADLSKNGQISICNALGQKVRVLPTTGNSTLISNQFEAGVYILTLEVGSLKATRKFIID